MKYDILIGDGGNDMNKKMTAIADEIGSWIIRYYEEEYLKTLWQCGFCIEDVIFQILIECCRCAYLVNAEKHPVSYYIENEGLEIELARKEIKRTMDYVKQKFDLEANRLKETLEIDVRKPDVKLVKKEKGRYPAYDISRFQYWELNNIHNMHLVKAIVERRIGSSKKVDNTTFREMMQEYDSVILDFKGKIGQSEEDTVYSSLILFTLQTKYALDFYYELAVEMEAAGIKEIPDMKNRIMCMAGTYKCNACLPQIAPKAAGDADCIIEYPMILQRRRFVKGLVREKKGGMIELPLAAIMEANVLANAVQSHMRFGGRDGMPQPMREWFVENTALEDWASVFETYNVCQTFIPNKEWTDARIHAVRKMYDLTSIDYGKLKHPEKRP